MDGGSLKLVALDGDGVGSGDGELLGLLDGVVLGDGEG